MKLKFLGNLTSSGKLAMELSPLLSLFLFFLQLKENSTISRDCTSTNKLQFSSSPKIPQINDQIFRSNSFLSHLRLINFYSSIQNLHSLTAQLCMMMCIPIFSPILFYSILNSSNYVSC